MTDRSPLDSALSAMKEALMKQSVDVLHRLDLDLCADLTKALNSSDPAKASEHLLHQGLKHPDGRVSAAVIELLGILGKEFFTTRIVSELEQTTGDSRPLALGLLSKHGLLNEAGRMEALNAAFTDHPLMGLSIVSYSPGSIDVANLMRVLISGTDHDARESALLVSSLAVRRSPERAAEYFPLLPTLIDIGLTDHGGSGNGCFLFAGTLAKKLSDPAPIIKQISEKERTDSPDMNLRALSLLRLLHAHDGVPPPAKAVGLFLDNLKSGDPRAVSFAIESLGRLNVSKDSSKAIGEAIIEFVESSDETTISKYAEDLALIYGRCLASCPKSDPMFDMIQMRGPAFAQEDQAYRFTERLAAAYGMQTMLNERKTNP